MKYFELFSICFKKSSLGAVKEEKKQKYSHWMCGTVHGADAGVRQCGFLYFAVSSSTTVYKDFLSCVHAWYWIQWIVLILKLYYIIENIQEIINTWNICGSRRKNHCNGHGSLLLPDTTFICRNKRSQVKSAVIQLWYPVKKSLRFLSPPPALPSLFLPPSVPLILTSEDHAENFTQSPRTAVRAPVLRANMLA